jgi:hypothetical protein
MYSPNGTSNLEQEKINELRKPNSLNCVCWFRYNSSRLFHLGFSRCSLGMMLKVTEHHLTI